MQKVVLYGVGLAGEKFYCLNKNKYVFEYAIDQRNGRFFHGIPVYSLEEKKDSIKQHFIVIATESNEVYAEIAEQLEKLELLEFRNYISVNYINRNLAIFYGNCHMIILEKYLCNQTDFSRKYVIRNYYVAHLEEKKRYPNDWELRHCKLLISQDIQENNFLHLPGINEIIKKVSNDCICVKIPNLYGFNLFFPQAKEFEEKLFKQHLNENAINVDSSLRNYAYIKSVVRWIIGFGDENINRCLCERGGGAERIRHMIEYDMVYSKEDIIRNYFCQIEKLKNREKNCDIKIADYIEENYRDKQLFYDPNHPTNEIICEKGRRILRFLDLRENAKSLEDALDDGEMFIYGCVRNALGLRFKQKYIKQYRNNKTLHNHALDIDEYIEEYLAWYSGSVFR